MSNWLSKQETTNFEVIIGIIAFSLIGILSTLLFQQISNESYVEELDNAITGKNEWLTCYGGCGFVVSYDELDDKINTIDWKFMDELEKNRINKINWSVIIGDCPDCYAVEVSELGIWKPFSSDEQREKLWNNGNGWEVNESK